MQRTITFYHPDNEGALESEITTLFSTFSSNKGAEGARVLSHEPKDGRDILTVDGDFNDEQQVVIKSLGLSVA